MVSIPDWTKFSRTVEGLKKPHSSQPLNKFFYQQEQVALREAEEQGYFLVPSCDYILKYLGPCNAMSKSIKQIFLVKLDGVHMQKLGDISLCTNLQICILANNFLTNVDALARCYHLVKLDLHGNQVRFVAYMRHIVQKLRIEFAYYCLNESMHVGFCVLILQM